MFGLSTSLPLAPSVAVVLSLPSSRPSIERIQANDPRSQFKNFLKIAPTFIENSDKIVLTDKQMEEAILHLRGGSGLTDVVAIMVFVIFINWLDGANSFQVNLPPHMDPMGWIQGSYNQPKPGPSSSFSKPGYPSTSLQLERPSAIPHPEYVGMTKEQKRNLPDERDGFITVEGHPHLVARYGQVEFKTPDHSSVHDLPINEKGQTPKTEENAIALRDSIVNMPNRKKIEWFDNGMYQRETGRGYDSVNIYDRETRVIAIFKKQEDGEYSQFTTTCIATPDEERHLFESGGNFVTENVLKDQKALTIIKNPIKDITTKNNDDL